MYKVPIWDPFKILYKNSATGRGRVLLLCTEKNKNNSNRCLLVCLLDIWLITKLTKVETYQTIGVILGIISTIIGILVAFAGFIIIPLDIGITLIIGVWVTISSFTCIFISLANPERHCKHVAIALIVIGVFGPWLMIIPGIIAAVYKPKGTGTEVFTENGVRYRKE